MIAQMMQGTTAMLNSQFKKPDLSTAKDEADLRGSAATTRLNTANARVAERSLGKPLPYTSLQEAIAGEGAGGIEEYIRTAEGAELTQGAAARLGPPIIQKYIEEWRASNGFTEEEIHSKEIMEYQEEMLRKRHGDIEQLIMGAVIEEAGGQALRKEVDTSNVDTEAGEKTRGLFAKEKEPIKLAITTAPTAKETRKYKKQWEVLSLDAGERYAASEEGFGKDKKAVDAWVLKEWLPNAMEKGTDLQGGAYLKELRGLTADPNAKATKSYVSAITNSVRKAVAKFLEVGEGLGLKPGPARRRGGQVDRLFKAAAGALIPDALSEYGEDVYPEEYEDVFGEKVEPGRKIKT
jgi:hypothetical protein